MGMAAPKTLARFPLPKQTGSFEPGTWQGVTHTLPSGDFRHCRTRNTVSTPPTLCLRAPPTASSETSNSSQGAWGPWGPCGPWPSPGLEEKVGKDSLARAFRKPKPGLWICARFCASDLRILCSILCFGFVGFVLDFVLRICGFCARCCASDLRILCSILCFGFVGFVLDVVLRICGFCA